MKKSTIAFLSASILFGLNSCDSLVESIYDLDKPGEIEEVKKKIIEEVGDLLVYDVTITSQNELETSLNMINLVTAEGAKEGGLDRKLFYLIDEFEPSTSPINEAFVEAKKKNDPKKISDLDFSLIEKNFDAAKKQLPKEFINPCLYTYTIDFKDNKRSDSFMIHCTKEGDTEHMEGRSVVTDYYKFQFITNENGEIVLDLDE